MAKHFQKKKFDEGQQRHKKHAGHLANADHNLNIKLFLSDSALSTKEDEAEIWFVDSGASSHMTCKRKWFKISENIALVQRSTLEMIEGMKSRDMVMSLSYYLMETLGIFMMLCIYPR